MAESTPERLRRLERLVEEKSGEKEQLEKETEETEQEIEETKRRLTLEIEELRRDQEVRELSERVALMESQGRSDEQIVAELRRRGIDPSTVRNVMHLHAHDHPGHDHDAETMADLAGEEGSGTEGDDGTDGEGSLEELAADAPERARGQNALYAGQEDPFRDLSERVSGAQSLYDLTSRDTYDSLAQVRENVQQRGFMTDNEYQVLNTFQQQLEQRQRGTQNPQYARRQHELIEGIKELAGPHIDSIYDQ